MVFDYLSAPFPIVINKLLSFWDISECFQYQMGFALDTHQLCGTVCFSSAVIHQSAEPSTLRSSINTVHIEDKKRLVNNKSASKKSFI